MLNDEPISLATVIPRRKRGGWDEKRANKKSKLDTVDAAINIMEDSNENILQAIHQASLKRGIREANSSRVALGDLTNKRISKRHPEEEYLKHPSPQKVPRTKHKRAATQNRELSALEIDSSGDEQGEITNEMRLKPTLYHLAQIDLESVKNKDNYMRGTCVQAIIELLHSEKGREDLTCVSTDFYTLLTENKFAEAKKLLHPDEGCHNWEKPAKKIATATSRILVIPCHAVNHWFLTLRIKLQGGKHQVLIIDSLGQKSGTGYMSKIRERLKQMNLITKKDKCTVLKTRGQAEVECGVRMAAYMVLFRSMNLQQLRDAQILQRIKSHMATENGFAGELAAHRRKAIHRLLVNEQAKIRK
jgi:Ulp1 family protease